MYSNDELCPLHDVNSAADQIDSAIEKLHRGIVTEREVIGIAASAVFGVLTFSLEERDSVRTLVDYAMVMVEHVANLPGIVDPMLVDEFHHRLRGLIKGAEFSERLGGILDGLESSIQKGDQDAREELITMCRSGHHTHPHLLALRSAGEQIISAAHRTGTVEGLASAVSPRYSSAGQIADRERYRDNYRQAMDSLGHLAADPDHGDQAREALVELVDFVETAADAAIRIPTHLLERTGRQKLLESYERRIEFFESRGGGEASILDFDILRANHVIKSTIWQANDARHTR